MKYTENLFSPDILVSAVQECVKDSTNAFKYTRGSNVLSCLIQKSLCRLLIRRETKTILEFTLNLRQNSHLLNPLRKSVLCDRLNTKCVLSTKQTYISVHNADRVSLLFLPQAQIDDIKTDICRAVCGVLMNVH